MRLAEIEKYIEGSDVRVQAREGQPSRVDRWPVTDRQLADAIPDRLKRAESSSAPWGEVRAAGIGTKLRHGDRTDADACFPPARAERNDGDRSVDEAVIERISADMQRPVDDVRPLYLAELAELSSSARLQAFVSIIATKRVKAALRATTAR